MKDVKNIKEKIKDFMLESNVDAMDAFRKYMNEYKKYEQQGSKLLISELVMKMSMAVKLGSSKVLTEKLKQLLPEFKKLM